MPVSASSLRHAFRMSPQQPLASEPGTLLANVEFSPGVRPQAGAFAGSSGLHAPLPLPALDGAGRTANASETWLAAPFLQQARHGRVRLAHNGDFLFGAVEIEEDGTFPRATASSRLPPLQAAAQAAYTAIFSALDHFGFRDALRFWNYMPDINRDSHGLERYRQFNMGRQSGFLASGRQVEGAVVPAATAVGHAEGPLSVHFLAARAMKVLAVENPRQVSAYHYPEQYGPRTPTFSRASLFHPQGKPALFVSGTASIVGHASLHPGDIGAQVGETMANIAAVLREANRIAPAANFALEEMAYRVYVRHPADCPAIEHALRRLLGPAASLLYLRADICREELLVEIEAVAGLA